MKHVWDPGNETIAQKGASALGQRLLQSLKRLLMAMDGYKTDQQKSIDFVEKFERRMV